jgi:DNA polymerase-3 subunit alpha
MGIEVLAPDANESARDFTVVEEGIRFGLAGVKNVGEGAIDSILAARKEGGPFTSLFDFSARIDSGRVNRRVVESLVKCGAFDWLTPSRARLWNALDSVLEAGAAAQRDREIGQGSLFGGDVGAPPPEPALPEAPEWTERQRLEFEKEVLGFYVTGHPLASVAKLLDRFADVKADDVAGREGREVRAGGLLTALRETRTRRGALMAFGTLEDLTGSFDLVIFAEPFGQHATLLKSAMAGAAGEGPQPLLVSGNLEAGDTPKILVRDVLSLDRAEEKLCSQLRVRVLAREATRDRLTALRQLFDESPGECAVALHLVIPDESETVLALPGRRGVRPDPRLRQRVDDLFGRPVTDLAL